MYYYKSILKSYEIETYLHLQYYRTTFIEKDNKILLSGFR